MEIFGKKRSQNSYFRRDIQKIGKPSHLKMPKFPNKETSAQVRIEARSSEERLDIKRMEARGVEAAKGEDDVVRREPGVEWKLWC